MLSRRQLLLATASAALLPLRSYAIAGTNNGKLDWQAFLSKMQQLAADQMNMQPGLTSQRGIEYLKQLDVTGNEFHNAIDAAYESGNHYWLWQRMIKQHNINGGILNIYNKANTLLRRRL